MSSDWALLRLGDFLSELPKSTLPASCAEANGAYAFYCSSSEPKAADTWLQEQPAILMGTGGVASVHLGKGKYAYSTDTWAIRIKESAKLTQPYAYRALELSLPKIDYAGFEGSGLRHLRKSYVKDFRFLAPSHSAPQKRIVSILDSIDTTIEKTEALIAKYQQIKAGLMRDLFTRGVLPNGQLRPPREQAPELYQETAIGWIPKEWQYELLDKLALRGSGHTPNKNFPEYWNGGIKWVSLADSHRLDQLYISDTELQISHKGIQNSSAVLHPAGIVVLSRDAGVGKSAITTEPMAVSQHFMCWKCDQKMDNHFLYYWLQFNKRTFENIAMGSTILTIGLPYFKKMKIACPIELEEQRNIAAKIKASDVRIFSLQDKLSKLNQQKQGLMHDLLTGKVPVKIEEPEVVDG
jgi:type I restriction enzyme S subunit